MSRIHRWSFDDEWSAELYCADGFWLFGTNDTPVPEELTLLLRGCEEDSKTEIHIPYECKGSYDPGSLDYPPDGDQDVYLEGLAVLETDYAFIDLDKGVTQSLWELFFEQIDEHAAEKSVAER